MADTSSVIIDSLPYADEDYNQPGVREAVDALIAAEMRTFRPKDYLAHLPPVPTLSFEKDPVLAAEFERMRAKRPMEKVDMSRYELPAPPAAAKNDLAAWQAAVSNSRAQLEHQGARLANLELFSQHGANAWRVHVEQLKQMHDALNKTLNAIQAEIEETNRLRRNEQVAAGHKLVSLEERWWALIGKNYELELACVQLERETTELRRQYGIANGDSAGSVH